MKKPLSVAEALEHVCRHALRLPSATHDLGEHLLGYVLAEDVVSDLDMPPFERAMMDGFAVRHTDCNSGTATLQIVDEILAGKMPTRSIGPGEASRIMTGASLPQGADAVVMIEKCRVHADNRVTVEDTPRLGQHIMPRGKELQLGEKVLTEGSLLRPQELGLLASVGKTTVSVYRTPIVAVLSTGDELVEPTETPGPGQIRNSNAALLLGLIARANTQPRYLGIAADNEAALHSRIDEGLRADVLVLSGGVSMGERDLVPQVLTAAGVQEIFHKVHLKPGKPLFFGKRESTLVFGLPGNPVSSFVGFELFVRPAIRLLQGRSSQDHSGIPTRLTSEYRHRGERPTYHPSRLELRADGWWAAPVPWLGSSDLKALCSANSLVIFPAGDRLHEAGSVVEALAPECEMA